MAKMVAQKSSYCCRQLSSNS